MGLFKRLRRKIDYLDENKVQLIQQSYLVALDAHRGQKRLTGDPYITHPVAVACNCADWKLDYQTIMAALLHDVIEDTAIEKEDLQQQFGKTVAELVDGVSKLTQIEFVSRAEAQAENFRKMVLAMSRDIRVILVKLADRLHNMRTIDSLPAAKQRRIAKETLDIFAPISNRLGMRDLAVELEELGFKARYPRRYDILKSAIRRARGNRKKILNLIDKVLNEGLVKSQITSCTVSGREKHLYSIYRKMRAKRIPFNEIMDVYAFRIIVDKVDTCYRVLGVVHGLFKPVPERFKDYIAIPKANGYQSLHTTLFGPYGLPIEVQIRTTEMDRIATNGIAAHWLYKTKEMGENGPTNQAQKWVQNLLELQQRTGNSLEFIESVKVDLFPDEVYVFTPRGDIKELPMGATALDFAYCVHTDVGNHCVAVKIDRELVPLSTVLANGNTVEVISAPNARPNPAWLDFLVTGKARSSIRHYLKSQRKEESIALGYQLLDKALHAHNFTLKKFHKPAIEFVLQESKYNELDSLLEDIGLGNRAAILVAQRLVDIQQGTTDKLAPTVENREAPLIIQGTEGMVIRFSSCCCPIPGDPIVGIFNAGKGIAVHVDKCTSVANLRHIPEQCIPLRWSERAKGDFAVHIKIQFANERGVLGMIALAIADAEANIEDIKVTERSNSHYILDMKVLVRNRGHLAQILRHLREVPAVIKIVRAK